MAYFVGLISGTSADAIDAALVDITDSKIVLSHYLETPYPRDIRSRIERLISSTADSLTAAEFGLLDRLIGDAFGKAATNLLAVAGIESAQVCAIGSHGQTIFHAPSSNPPFSVQLGDPNVIAFATGITTIADFRRMDIAAGGQGAPLVPPFHATMFTREDYDVAVVNIGGIANVTLLPSRSDGPVIAYDTGPGNTLLDHWVHRHQGLSYDADGDWARTGQLMTALLHECLHDPYFALPPPKSTGREYFNRHWLDEKLKKTSATTVPAVDVQRTLVELSALTITRQIQQKMPKCAEIILCGGGVGNSFLVETIATATPAAITTTDTYKVPHAAVEAMAFAWLAQRRTAGLPGNLPSVTGANRSVQLGGIYRSDARATPSAA
ncbi:MAG: anhydro-N-acetylmuramic acid kinase [Gammaproteobacteria bacterium]|nr:anhydro-N-acetylmuramic acid kinase [Gammaproteobacteria bacterium]